MLESNYQSQLDLLLDRLQTRVQLPEAWTDYFERTGMLAAAPVESRRYARRYLREEAICELDKTLPAIERQHEFFKVYLKDASRAGVAFMAAHQLYPGEDLFLWTRDTKLFCTVVRCRKHCDFCFEIGATFL